ncbi:hypothetical protein WA588_005108, partial [Blastocystis sp. NMH]
MGVVTVTNTSGKIIAIKMKSNAGKHIIAKPSIFIMGVDETHDVEISIRSPNVNSLVAIARDMRRKEEQFKLQFNVLELTRLFYDKVKDAQSSELTDLLNKRWNMAEKGSVKQSILAVHLVYPDVANAPSPTVEKKESTEPASSTPSGLQYFSLEDEYKKLMIANTKLKEFTEELRKKYKNVQKQLELLQMNTHLREEERNEKEGEKVQPIYTGISMYQLLL